MSKQDSKMAKGVLQTVRKTWDKNSYQQKAQDRVAQDAANNSEELEEVKKKRSESDRPIFLTLSSLFSIEITWKWDLTRWNREGSRACWRIEASLS